MDDKSRDKSRKACFYNAVVDKLGVLQCSHKDTYWQSVALISVCGESVVVQVGTSVSRDEAVKWPIGDAGSGV